MITRVWTGSFTKSFTKAREYCTWMTEGLLNVFDIPFSVYHTEAAVAESREVAIVMSGAWKT